jgi:hypothetical protein
MNMMDVYPGGEGWKENMYNWMCGNGTNFASFRTIRNYTPELISAIEEFLEYANAKNDGYTYKYVDMYTLFDLVIQSGQGDHVYGN